MKRIAVLFFLVSLAILPAKEKKQPKDVPPDGHIDAWVTADNQSRVAKEVRHNLAMLPYFGVFDDLGFTIDGGTVTLVGAVTRPVLKDDAERTVKKVEGVDHVVNNIEVLPLSPMDDGIRRRVFRAIYGDPSLSTKYGFRAMPSIHIIVKNGDVRLEGVVATQMDKTLAGMRASGVSGTFTVTNSLRVEGTA